MGNGGDKLNLKDLLSYTSSDTLSNFISVSDDGDNNDVVINIDANGDGSGTK
jgi:hypothetical protein